MTPIWCWNFNTLRPLIHRGGDYLDCTGSSWILIDFDLIEGHIAWRETAGRDAFLNDQIRFHQIDIDGHAIAPFHIIIGIDVDNMCRIGFGLAVVGRCRVSNDQAEGPGNGGWATGRIADDIVES